MSAAPHPEDDLDRLLSVMIDGRATPQHQQELAALLRHNPQLHSKYIDYICLDTILAWEHASEPVLASRSLASAPALADPEHHEHRDRVVVRVTRRVANFARLAYQRKGVASLAALLTAVAILLWVSALPNRARRGVDVPTSHLGRSESIESPSADPADVPLARLLVGDAPRFEGGDQPVDGVFRQGQYALVEGAISLRFSNGVELTLESPAGFELVHPKLVVLHHGKARAQVPQSGIGFVVAAPGVKIEDLGTEFGVLVDRDRTTSLRVFTGAVELHREGQQPLQLEEDSTAILRDGEHALLEDASELEFLTSTEIAYRQWRAASDRLRNDPAVVLYYDFERDPRQPNLLKDRSGRAPGIDGLVRGGLWLSGRWPQKGALLFENEGDCVEMNIPEAFDAFTLHCWLRVSRLDLPSQAIVSPRGWNRPGQHEMHILNTGQLITGIKGSVTVKNFKENLGTVPIGRWLHLAAVVDRIHQRASYYLNGQELLTRSLHVDFPLDFGPTIIGSFALKENARPPYDRQFRGWIDELALFSRAFTTAEVRALYEQGRVFSGSLAGAPSDEADDNSFWQ